MTTKQKQTLETVKNNSLRCSNEAFAVLDKLKEGDVSLKEASEMSNALGKVNAANANVIKADLLALAMDKQSQQSRKKADNKTEE